MAEFDVTADMERAWMPVANVTLVEFWRSSLPETTSE